MLTMVVLILRHGYTIRKNDRACSSSANYDNYAHPVCVPNGWGQQEKDTKQ